MSVYPLATSRATQEEAVGELQDVRLVDGGHLLAAVLPRVFEGVLDDRVVPVVEMALMERPRVGTDVLAVQALDLGDDLGRLGLVLLELAAEVEVLGVLADDDQVDLGVGEIGPDAGEVLAGPDAGVEVEGLPEVDVDAPEAGPDGRRDRGPSGPPWSVGTTRSRCPGRGSPAAP
jgi:hypothetical protein